MEIQENEQNLKSLLDETSNSEDNDQFISFISDPKNKAWEYIDSSGNSLLLVLLSKNQIKLAKKVIEIFQNMTTPEIFFKFINHQDNKGINALHKACFKGDMSLVKLLIEKGIDYRAKSKTGLSCIHCAAQTNKVSVIYYLVNEYNIDLYEKDNYGNYFYHWACHSNCERVIDFFLNDKNFQINIKNNDGYIPLHYYLMEKNTRSLKRLIYRGADPYIKNNRGENSFDIVANNKSNDIHDKKEIKKILETINFSYSPFIAFFFYHFIFPFLIIIFDFPFIDTSKIILLERIYLLWNCFVWIYILYFLYKSPGEIKPNPKGYLLKLLENDKENNIDLWYFCIKCEVRKDIDSKHCFFCDKCVKDWDHHCIWLKKCIGNNNKKSFQYLLVIVIINSIFNLVLCVISEIGYDIKNYFIFTQNLANNIRTTRAIKAIILVFCFISTLFASLVIYPVIKVYIQKIKWDEIFGSRKKELIDLQDYNENDEKEHLILKNDD